MSHSDPLLLQPSQMPALDMSWPPVTNSDLTNTQQNPILTSQTSYGGMPTGAIANDGSSLATAPWTMLHSAPTNTPTVFGATAELVFVDTSTGAHVPLRPPFVLPDPPVQVHVQTHVQAPAPTQLDAVPPKKKSASKSKLPAQRAPKTKLSRRQGKLSEEGRANAAAVRKLGPCTRCKLYHVRVCQSRSSFVLTN
jgi:hypothetical protein